MSYNIDTWKTKELKDFSIPLIELKEEEDYLEKPELDLETGLLSFAGRSEGFELQGHKDGDVLVVERILNYGEASGTMQKYLEEDIFPHSTGLLHAVLIWEGGDSITRLTVKDGFVTSEGIEL